MTLADRIAVFFDGEIKQIGTPAEVFNRPRTTQVAAFIGSPPMNLLPETLQGRQLTIAGKTIQLPVESSGNGEVTVGVRPSHIRIDADGIPAQLYLLENLGESHLLNLHLGENLIKMCVTDTQGFKDGDTVGISFDTDALHLFDRQTGLRID